MNLTSHQQDVVNYVTSNDDLVLVEAVAGAGKTTLLTAIADAVPHKNSAYLAYNKSIAVNSKKKFPSTTHCMTTHSMAYQAIVIPNKLKVGFFNYKSIKERIPYLDKCTVIDLMKEFCLSRYVTYEEFVEAQEEDISKYTKHVVKYLDLMDNGKIEVSHEFYLKRFHLALAHDEIEYEPFDFLMLDEAGDLNEVTLEIFLLLPSKKKIAVGDPHQNIYSFNHTINCFDVLEGKGKKFNLPQSFRVPSNIAPKIECFCNTYLDPHMDFEGTFTSDKTIESEGYITRTNGALIGKMVTLNAQGTSYGLTRKASEIFKLPLMLASMKYQGFVPDPSYQHIQTDFNTWTEKPDLKMAHKSPFSYIASLYDDDIQLVNACKLLNRYGKGTIYDTYKEAKNHEGKKHPLTLATAHSSKGLEFDKVTIGDDLNMSIADVVNYVSSTDNPIITSEQRESLNLYYVACTRALKHIENATHLKQTAKCAMKRKLICPEEFI
jgi:superfamily I DNA/RNA helicase